jgi:hypothetical protein
MFNGDKLLEKSIDAHGNLDTPPKRGRRRGMR